MAQIATIKRERILQELTESLPRWAASVMQTKLKSGEIDFPKLLEFHQKLHRLRYLLNKDILGCEAKWTFFVCAALCYEFEKRVRPLPKAYIYDGRLQIDSLMQTIYETPKLSIFLFRIVQGEPLDEKVLDLLHWVLINCLYPILHTVPKHEHIKINSALDSAQALRSPTSIFEIFYSKQSMERFAEFSQKFPIKKAFYVDKLQHFYALINTGFVNENDVLPTFYLQPADAIKMAKECPVWGATHCGSIMSCIAVCEYAEDPRFIKLLPAHETLGPRIHILKSDLVHLRYLFLYDKNISPVSDNHGSLQIWLNSHKRELAITYYIVLFGLVSLVGRGCKIRITNKLGRVLMQFLRKIFVGH